MNKRAQIPLDNPLALVTFLVFVVVITGLMMTFVTTITCKAEKNEIAALNNRISQLETEMHNLNATALHWKREYINLTNSSVTKKDIAQILDSLDNVHYNMNQTNYQITNIQTQISTINYFQNIIFALSIPISIGFTLFAATLVDFAANGLGVTFEIIKKTREWKLRRKKKNPKEKRARKEYNKLQEEHEKKGE